MLALTHPPVLPSAMLNDVGTPVAIISQLNTLPAFTPVNASVAALRLAMHDSGPGRIATPFPYDSFIHNSTPVYPGALCSQLTLIDLFQCLAQVALINVLANFRQRPLRTGLFRVDANIVLQSF